MIYIGNILSVCLDTRQACPRSRALVGVGAAGGLHYGQLARACVRHDPYDPPHPRPPQHRRWLAFSLARSSEQRMHAVVALGLSSLGFLFSSSHIKEPPDEHYVQCPQVLEPRDDEVLCRAFQRKLWANAALEPRQQALSDQMLADSKSGPLRLLISGEDNAQLGWVVTNWPTFDVLNASSMALLGLGWRFHAVSAVAEHVWEHFDYVQAFQALVNMRCAMLSGRLRIAVPDAAHADVKWYVKKKVQEGWPAGFFGGGAKKSKSARYPGHRALWTARKLVRFACDAGYKGAWLQEYWKESKPNRFVQFNYSDEFGYISRSARNDPRNNAKSRNTYTSLIVDLVAPSRSKEGERVYPSRRSRREAGGK